jgi:hypothetical protein
MSARMYQGLRTVFQTPQHHIGAAARVIGWSMSLVAEPVVLSLSMALQPFVRPWPPFQFLDFFTQSLGLLRRGISPSQSRNLHAGQHKHRTNAHTSMPQVGFKPTIPVFQP